MVSRAENGLEMVGFPRNYGSYWKSLVLYGLSIAGLVWPGSVWNSISNWWQHMYRVTIILLTDNNQYFYNSKDNSTYVWL